MARLACVQQFFPILSGTACAASSRKIVVLPDPVGALMISNPLESKFSRKSLIFCHAGRFSLGTLKVCDSLVASIGSVESMLFPATEMNSPGINCLG